MNGQKDQILIMLDMLIVVHILIMIIQYIYLLDKDIQHQDRQVLKNIIL